MNVIFEEDNTYGLISYKDEISAKTAIERVIANKKLNNNYLGSYFKEGDEVIAVGVGIRRRFDGVEEFVLLCFMINSDVIRCSSISPEIFNNNCIITGDCNKGDFQPLGKSLLEIAKNVIKFGSFRVSNKRGAAYEYLYENNKKVQMEELVEGKSFRNENGKIYAIRKIKIFDYNKVDVINSELNNYVNEQFIKKPSIDKAISTSFNNISSFSSKVGNLYSSLMYPYIGAKFLCICQTLNGKSQKNRGKAILTTFKDKVIIEYNNIRKELIWKELIDTDKLIKYKNKSKNYYRFIDENSITWSVDFDCGNIAAADLSKNQMDFIFVIELTENGDEELKRLLLMAKTKRDSLVSRLIHKNWEPPKEYNNNQKFDKNRISTPIYDLAFYENSNFYIQDYLSLNERDQTFQIKLVLDQILVELKKKREIIPPVEMKLEKNCRYGDFTLLVKLVYDSTKNLNRQGNEFINAVANMGDVWVRLIFLKVFDIEFFDSNRLFGLNSVKKPNIPKSLLDNAFIDQSIYNLIKRYSRRITL